MNEQETTYRKYEEMIAAIYFLTHNRRFPHKIQVILEHFDPSKNAGAKFINTDRISNLIKEYQIQLEKGETAVRVELGR